MPEEAKLLSRDELKQVTKEAIKEWMDEKFSEVGKWSVRIIVTAALGALMAYMMSHNGNYK